MEKYRNGVDFDETVILLLLTLLGVTVEAASAGTRSVGSVGMKPWHFGLSVGLLNFEYAFVGQFSRLCA